MTTSLSDTLSVPAVPAVPAALPAEVIAGMLRDLAASADAWREQLAHPPVEPAVADGPAGPRRSRGAEAVRAHLKQLVGSATTSLVWLRRGPDAPAWGGIRAVSERTCHELDVRVLLCVAPGDVAAAAAPLRVGSGGGPRVRVQDDLPGVEFLVVDGTVACEAGLDADGEPVLREVRDPAAVAALCGAFATSWTYGATLIEAERVGRLLDADVKRSIIGMLVDGMKDESMARTLGISLRTCRRHVADIMASLDSGSRFQAGYQLAMSGGRGAVAAS